MWYSSPRILQSHPININHYWLYFKRIKLKKCTQYFTITKSYHINTSNVKPLTSFVYVGHYCLVSVKIRHASARITSILSFIDNKYSKL